MKNKLPPKLSEWVFKAMWPATALELKVQGKTLEEALKRAENQVLKMEGGSRCLSVEMVRQLS